MGMDIAALLALFFKKVVFLLQSSYASSINFIAKTLKVSASVTDTLSLYIVKERYIY